MRFKVNGKWADVIGESHGTVLRNGKVVDVKPEEMQVGDLISNRRANWADGTELVPIQAIEP